MTELARLPREERRTYFQELQLRHGVEAVIIEKDFWVVWLLERIFGVPELCNTAVFKGGTSLSKVFGAIARFSEDIDLGICPASLGWNEQDLLESSQNKWIKKQRPSLEAACAEQVETVWLPKLEAAVVDRLGPAPDGRNWLRYELEEKSHSPVIHFDYPGALPSGVSYILRSVKMEFGSLADQRPTGRHTIRAMVDDFVPGAFSDIGAEVVALEIERTFWEKATILHAEYHRPADKPQPDRYSRHYADFAALWRHDAGHESARRLDLLERVRTHKAKFFASGWAHYDTAVPGSLRLVPPKSRVDELRRDYAAMLPMFLDDPRSFNEVLAILREAEVAINGL